MTKPDWRDRRVWSVPVGDSWIAPDSDAQDVIDPATGTVIARVPRVSAGDVDAAIQAADIAMQDWAAQPAIARADILLAWDTLIKNNAEAIAVIVTAECGKPLSEARGEVAYGASFIRWFAEEVRRSNGEVIPSPTRGRTLLSIRRPVGVVAAITPWNFPVAMVTRKLAPALAAGCAALLKPAPETPLSAIALAELAQEAGLPKGLFSVLTGDAVEIGGVLTSDPRVAKLTFTGSTEVGRLLMAQCAPTVKRVSLELGGNAPVLVFDDADLERAVDGALAAKFRNSGQTCVCANRIYVHASVADQFADLLAAKVSAFTVGPGSQDGVDIGPLISTDAMEKVARHVADAVARGGRVLTGGHAHALGPPFWEPTVIADVSPGALCAREETFGPLAPIIPFETEAEAIALANDSPFGLAAYLFTSDLGRILRLGDQIEAGMIGINTGLISTAEAPFGGVKQSGLGREGSQHGLSEYQEIKYLCIEH